MKLLSPQQAQANKSQELSRDILRTQEVREALRKANQQLAESEAEFNIAKAKRLNAWAEEEKEHAELVKHKEKEIRGLEERKSQALIPISLYKDQAEKLMEEAKHGLKIVQEKEERMEERNELLQDKLDEVNGKEQELNTWEKKLKSQQEGIDLQGKQIKLQNEQLTKEIADFATKKFEEETFIFEKKKELLMENRSIEAKKKILQKTEEAQAKERKRLDDERATLQRAFDRLKA